MLKMKRTLIRTWKIIMVWLFVCYEIGSLLDYIFFSLVHLFISVVSFVVSFVYGYVIYPIYATLAAIISFAITLTKLLVVLLISNLAIYIYTLIPIFIDYTDTISVFFWKEVYLTYICLESSLMLVISDIISKLC